MLRQDARQNLMQLFYQMDINSDFTYGQQDTFFADIPSWQTEKRYVDTCMKIFLEHKDEIDKKISEASPKWNLSRFSKIDLAILRLAICEIIYTDIPVQVAINEAVNLGKIFSNEEENKIINGILGTVVRSSEILNTYRLEE